MTEPRCPDCGSGNITGERDHGDTICVDCGWFTEEGSPDEPVDWEQFHNLGEDGGDDAD